MIKTVWFDLDDTLLDFRAAESTALRKAFQTLNIPCGDAVLQRYRTLNEQQWRLLEQGKLTMPQVLVRRFELLFEELGICRNTEETCEAYERCLAEGHSFIPGAPEVLEQLAFRYDLYLATNGTAQVQRSRLNSAGIRHWFQEIFISEEVGADKPSSAFFTRCFAAVSGFDPASAIMVGDSLTSDIRGGQNAGIHTCWFNFRRRPARPDILPDHTVYDLRELPALLERL